MSEEKKDNGDVKMMLRLPRPVVDALTRSGRKFALDARAMLEGHAITSARGADIPLKLADFMEAPKETVEEMPLPLDSAGAV